MSKKRGIFIAGKDEEGNIAMGGVFKMADTHGMPLVLVVDYLLEQNCVVAWDEYYIDAEKAGWKTETVENRIFEAVGDSYGTPYLEKFKSRLEKWKASR